MGEVIQEKAPRDKEKAEGPASTEKEKREQTSLKKVHAELEVKAKDGRMGMINCFAWEQSSKIIRNGCSRKNPT